MEGELQSEVDHVKENYPGYDEYILNNTEYIGHNVHELLSYITSRYVGSEYAYFFFDGEYLLYLACLLDKLEVAGFERGGFCLGLGGIALLRCGLLRRAERRRGLHRLGDEAL